jgi:tetratricopeptide (TPR) repeat protein
MKVRWLRAIPFMMTFFTKSIRVLLIFTALQALSTLPIRAQTTETRSSSEISGRVRDVQEHPLTGVTVSLEGTDPVRKLSTISDAQGKFHFSVVPGGTYTVHATLQGYEDCKRGPLKLPNAEAIAVIMTLTKSQEAAAIAFSDEPAFTVAGVTDTTALGGHGSGPVMRNSNALSKQTASLGNDAAPVGPNEEAAIRAKLAKEDTADLHAQLAEIEEAEGHPLGAVKDYQRAAEMQATEPHLFAWGAELLLHHAPEPAIEVFSKGHRLFPQSSRMMLGLGAAWYAQRSKEPAGQIFLQACDVNPADPTPYLFLGRLLVTEQVTPEGWTDRMKRFVSLHPENAMAHYLYAVALLKQSASPDQGAVAEAQLNAAIHLDPHLGDAYLQLGILRMDHEELPGAISALQKAVENTPVPDDAHYRLAQAYRRAGEPEKARKEVELFEQLAEQKAQEAERERHEFPQFIYTLRGQNSAPPPPVAPDSH